jgi:hypothetical protein
MDQSKPDVPPAKWQSAVTTIRCDYVDEYVSIMVQKDWTSKCTWYKQNKEPTSEGKKKVKHNKKIRAKIEKCQGPLCSYVAGYRDSLIKEEQESASRAASG